MRRKHPLGIRDNAGTCWAMLEMRVQGSATRSANIVDFTTIEVSKRE
jgi:hypothetical protein